MTLSKTILFYIGKKMLWRVIITTAVICAVATISALVQSLFQYHTYTVSTILKLALYPLPTLWTKILPFSASLGIMWTFLSLNKTQEMTIMRGFGHSPLFFFVLPTVFCLGLWSWLWLYGVDALNTNFLRKANELVRNMEGQQTSVTVLQKHFWIRSQNGEHTTYVYADSLSLPNVFKSGMLMVFRGQKMEKVYVSQTANLLKGSWLLHGVTVYTYPSLHVSQRAAIKIPTKLKLQEVFANILPTETIPFTRLRAHIEARRSVGLNPRELQMAIVVRLSEPLLLLAMIFVGNIYTVVLRPRARSTLPILEGLFSMTTLYLLMAILRAFLIRLPNTVFFLLPIALAIVVSLFYYVISLKYWRT